MPLLREKWENHMASILIEYIYVINFILFQFKVLSFLILMLEEITLPSPQRCLNYTPLPSYVKIYTPLPSYSKHIRNFFHSPPLREAWITFPSPLMLKFTLYSLIYFFLFLIILQRNNNLTHFQKNSIAALF